MGPETLAIQVPGIDRGGGSGWRRQSVAVGRSPDGPWWRRHDRGSPHADQGGPPGDRRKARVEAASHIRGSGGSCRRAPWTEMGRVHGSARRFGPGNGLVVGAATRGGEKAGRADYAAVGMALKRYELKMKKDPALRTETQMLERALLNVEI